MAMINKADKLLSFGAIAFSDGTEMENTLSVNKAQTERMKVEVNVKEAAAGGTSVNFILKGCETEGGSYTAISETGAIVTAKLTAGASFTLPIPDGVNFPFLKVTATKVGSFTAGSAEAYVDTYLGL